jgi:hypothetical protein
MTHWINHDGGPQPVADDVEVQVIDKNRLQWTSFARDEDWDEARRYRILNQHLIDAARKEGLQKGLEAFDGARLAVEGDIQKLIDAARLEGIRLGLEAAAKAADHDWPDPNSPIRRLDPETIALEAKPPA